MEKQIFKGSDNSNNTYTSGEWQIYYPTVTLTSASVNVKKIFINGNRLVILWSDNTRTMSTCGENDIFDPEIGFCIAIAKKIYGKKKYQRMLKKAEVQNNSDKLLKKFKKNTINFQKED